MTIEYHSVGPPKALAYYPPEQEETLVDKQDNPTVELNAATPTKEEPVSWRSGISDSHLIKPLAESFPIKVVRPEPTYKVKIVMRTNSDVNIMGNPVTFAVTLPAFKVELNKDEDTVTIVASKDIEVALPTFCPLTVFVEKGSKEEHYDVSYVGGSIAYEHTKIIPLTLNSKKQDLWKSKAE